MIVALVVSLYPAPSQLKLNTVSFNGINGLLEYHSLPKRPTSSPVNAKSKTERFGGFSLKNFAACKSATVPIALSLAPLKIFFWGESVNSAYAALDVDCVSAYVMTILSLTLLLAKSSFVP